MIQAATLLVLTKPLILTQSASKRLVVGILLQTGEALFVIDAELPYSFAAATHEHKARFEIVEVLHSLY